MKTIKFTVSYEKMISRLPSLFAYLEKNSQGEMVLHSATDALDGCYGKLVENIALPADCGVNYTKDDKTITLEEGKTYSYRTLIDYYYKYVNEDEPEWTNFIKFMEKGIGKFKVTGVSGNLVPEFIYLATAKAQKNELIKMQRQCQFYQNQVELSKNKNVKFFDKQMCCLCEKFDEMGGQKMIDFLTQCIGIASTIAEEYFGYADDAETSMSLKFPIVLTTREEDMGILTAAIEEWVAGKSYKKGEFAYYVSDDGLGFVYMAKRDNSGTYNATTEKIVFNPNDWEKQAMLSTDVDENNKTYYERNGVQGSAITGILNDNDHKISGTVRSTLKSLRRSDCEYMTIDDVAETPREGEDWLWYYRVGNIGNVETITDSFGNICQVNGDEVVNIPQTATTADGTKLAAWGDYISKIEAKNGVLRIEYYIGIHLKATYKEYKDINGFRKFYFADWEVDTDCAYGVLHYDEYTYAEDDTSDDSIAKLIADGEFDDYVNKKFDKGVAKTGVLKLKKYEKYPFDTFGSTSTYQQRVGNKVIDVPYIVSHFESNVNYREKNYQLVPLIRYDHSVGMSDRPKMENNVGIERGITQAFEKHIKLSEIKTFDDLENYANGGFFTMSQENISIG